MMHILLIDDSEDEQYLLEDELLQEDLSSSIKRVDNERDMQAALASSIEWDIALIDYFMPGFSAEQALQILKATDRDIPAIVVSGQASEEKAISMMRLGAKDYISKNNRFRLIPSIIRELESHNKRKQQQHFARQLHQTEQKLAAVAEAAYDAIILMKDDWSIEFWNAGAEKLFGFSKKEALGVNVNDFLIPSRYQKVFRRLFRHFAETGKFSIPDKTFEIIVLNKSRKEIPVELSLSSVKIDHDWIVIGIVRDISKRRDLERKLRRMASHDPLTSLVNRREIMWRLNQEMIRFYRYHSPVTILFIDIDNFKVINDTHGHNIGDKTLIDCARKMSSLMRRNDTIGRYGGEEFLVILPETHIKKAFDLAERLRTYIDKHSENAEQQIPHYTISIGITELTDEQMNISTFLNIADITMYKAKQTGRNRTCIDDC